MLFELVYERLLSGAVPFNLEIARHYRLQLVYSPIFDQSEHRLIYLAPQRFICVIEGATAPDQVWQERNQLGLSPRIQHLLKLFGERLCHLSEK